MLTYRFDNETKEFLYSEEAFLDPLETEKQGKEVYLLPANSTFLEPLEAKEDQAIVWSGSAWEHVEDHRQKKDQGGRPIEGTGTPYWLDGDTWQTPARYMVELGPLPEGALLVKPGKPFTILKEEKLKELAGKFTIAESNAYVISSLGFKIDAGETANRDINGLIAVMEATPEIETVNFCDYENVFHAVTLEDLKTMLLEIVQNGQSLYQQKWSFRNAIEAAGTKEALDVIVVEFVMLDFTQTAA